MTIDTLSVAQRLEYAQAVMCGLTQPPKPPRKDQPTFWKEDPFCWPDQLELIENVAEAYVEPGYTQPEIPLIAFGDWNNDNEKREYPFFAKPLTISEALEKLGADTQWLDEWTTCYGCQKAVRTSPNSYGWKASYAIIDGVGLYCHKCIEEDPTDYLESMEGCDTNAITFDLDVEKYGYVLAQASFENGFYDGQADNPKVIAASLKKRGISRFLFMIDSVGQFDLNFSLYIHESEYELFSELSRSESQQKESPATLLKRGLEAANAAITKLPEGDGVKVASINPDGTATVKLVNRQDFIDGKALD